MTIKIFNQGDSFTVSKQDVWYDGRFETEADARLATTVDEAKLNAAWKESIAAGNEGLIAHEALVQIKGE